MDTKNRSEDQVSRNSTLNSLLKGLRTQGLHSLSQSWGGVGGEEGHGGKSLPGVRCTHPGLGVLSIGTLLPSSVVNQVTWGKFGGAGDHHSGNKILCPGPPGEKQVTQDEKSLWAQVT